MVKVKISDTQMYAQRETNLDAVTTDTDGDRRAVYFADVSQEIERTKDPVASLAFIAGEVIELAEDDVDADRVDEPDHYRVGDPTKDRAEFEQTGQQHDQTGDDRQREQCPIGILGGVDHRDVGNDDRHGPGGLDRHERRTGEEGARERPRHVGV